MCRCPDLETFRRGTPALSVEDNFFSERVFAVVRPCTGWCVCARLLTPLFGRQLDRDCKGVIGFKEYLQGVHVLQRGSRQDLLKFLFAGACVATPSSSTALFSYLRVRMLRVCASCPLCSA